VKILFVSQWFDPEPTFKGLLFARALVRRGHHVEVLTGFPNYPGGRLYDGYRIRLRQVEERDGVRVVRLPLYPSHDASGVRRAANYASFAASVAVLGAWSVNRPEVIYAYHPPITVGIAAVLLGRVLRCPVVYDVQDLWPESVEASGMMPASLLGPLAAACGWVYRNADRVVTLSPGMAEMLARHGVARDRLSCIYNWCDEAALGGNGGSELLLPCRERGDFLVVYAGALGVVQGLEAVLGAAEILLRRSPRIHFAFVGAGVDANRLRASAAARGLSNTTFLPRQPIGKMGGLLRSADAVLVHLKDLPLFHVTVPSKTQAYMAIGRPIVMAVRGDAADLVKRACCGVVCEPEDPMALAEAIVSLATLDVGDRDAMAARGRQFYNAELSVDRGVSRFEAVFADAISGRFASRSLDGSAC
jgi:colanic acid biosynthesis glycosyl transferase WcaI